MKDLLKIKIVAPLFAAILIISMFISFSTAHAEFTKIIGQCNISSATDAHPVIFRIIYTYLALHNVPADDPKQRRFQIERMQLNLEDQWQPIDLDKNKKPILTEMNYSIVESAAQLVAKYSTATQYELQIDLTRLAPDEKNPNALQGPGSYKVPNENNGRPQRMHCDRLDSGFFPAAAE